MLTKFKVLKSVGQFDQVKEGDGLAPFTRMTLGYAENGRGKTTLSAILRSLGTGDAVLILERERLGAKEPPTVVLESTDNATPAAFQGGRWNRTLPEIAVFDDTFVDQNICSGLVVESGHRQKLHEFILGAQGVGLNAALQTAVERIEEHNRELRVRSDAVPAAPRGNLSIDDFCALPMLPNIDAEILDTERALGAAKDQDSVRDAQLFDAIELPVIDGAAIDKLLGRSLSHLEQVAADKVQAQLTRLGEQAQAWIAYGLGTVPRDIDSAQGDVPCPFCAQSLRGSEIIGHYRAYFGDAHTALQRDLDAAVKGIENEHGGEAIARFERAVRLLSERAAFWRRFADIPATDLRTDAIVATWSRARDKMRVALACKQMNVLEPIRLTESQRSAISDYDQVRDEVAALSARLEDANNAIRLVKEQAAAGNSAVLERDLVRLRSTKARYSTEIAALCIAYLDEKANKTGTEKERDRARAELDRYRNDVFPTYQGAINDYLRKFNAGFRLDQVTSQNIRGGSACTYSVLINDQSVPIAGDPGKPSFRNTLSAGDRNTLALAIFFAALDQSVSLGDRIVVIDDPISSLDGHRILATVREVRRLMDRTAQVIVLSHNKPFLCTLWEGADPTLRTAFELVRSGNGSDLRAWDVNQDLITEHDRRHALLREYVQAAGTNGREVAESLRPVLEAFSRVAFPRYYPPGTLLGPFRGICIQRVGRADEILNQTDVDELKELTDYANRFHHDTNPMWRSQGINDAELLDFVKRTLAFATR
jgi:wobble nucleotide-excising tRNase